jgi:hypothetical protein
MRKGGGSGRSSVAMEPLADDTGRLESAEPVGVAETTAALPLFEEARAVADPAAAPEARFIADLAGVRVVEEPCLPPPPVGRSVADDFSSSPANDSRLRGRSNGGGAAEPEPAPLGLPPATPPLPTSEPREDDGVRGGSGVRMGPGAGAPAVERMPPPLPLLTGGTAFAALLAAAAPASGEGGGSTVGRRAFMLSCSTQKIGKWTNNLRVEHTTRR